MKKLNPHSYIDGVPYYIVLVTLKNKDNDGKPYLLAMYS
jgi:hypothetical protein